MSAETLPVLGVETVSEIIEAVKDLPVLKSEDVLFLQEHAKHLARVMEKTHQWRTDVQKSSIVNDFHFPTTHAKFHQAMLEQKVQFEQAMYLAKDFEMRKLDLQELQYNIEDLGADRRDAIKKKKLELDLKFKTYELNQMQISMKYRMEEIRGWQKIQEKLLEELRAAGVDEETIWSKDRGEMDNLFFMALNNLQNINAVTDSAERGNLLSMAMFSYKTAKQSGRLEDLRRRCNAAQLYALKMIEPSLGA